MRPEIAITAENRDKILTGRMCPYCGGRTNYIDSKQIYGVSYGMMYICHPCKAYVGVHPGKQKKALGRLADAELRKLKKEAHRYFDGLWKHRIRLGAYKHRARTDAYLWLSKQLGIEKRYTHIGMFNAQQCLQVIELCKQFYNKNKSEAA